MFDWNDHDQVGDTIWGEFNESEDHIVPYPKDTEENTVFNFGDYSKKQRNEDASTVAMSTEQTSGAKNEFPGCNLENSSSFNTNEELSAPRLDMDTWPDLPSLSAELSKGYSNGSDRDSLERELMNEVTAGGTVQLDGEPELFGNEHEDKGGDSFLDCDWANIGDFDDLDRIFRNDSIFGHDMVANVDEFLSPSTDVIGSTTQSIPMPDITLSGYQPPEQGCSSFQLVEHSGGKRKPEEKTADSTVETRQQTIRQTHLSNQLSEKEDRKKKLLKSRKKAEERSKNKASQNFNVPWPQNIRQSQQFPGPKVHPSVITSLQTFQSPVICQQRQVGDAEPMGHVDSSSLLMFSQYGYPTYPFPGIPVLPHVQADRNQRKGVAVGHNLYPDPLKNSNTSNKVLDVQSGPLAMTPQEKIEKLKRRQQIQAMLAIQQQQQQFNHQNTGAENLDSQANSQKNQSQDAVTSNMGVEENSNKLPSSDLNILVEHDESQRISTLIDDSSLEETVYYQLQDALGKLDIRVRLCIRDSLFRLARSSMERQSASDRSSTNKSTTDEGEVPVTEETDNGKSPTRLPDEETYTNPIDRTVAHLLFHRPSESCTRPLNDEIPQSPVLCNLVSKLPLNICESMSEGEPESFGEMEVQPSL